MDAPPKVGHIRLFTNHREALFVRRPNRFLIIARDGDEEIPCHCPNPGRLIEFVFPGTRLILEKRESETTGPRQAKTAYTAVGLYYRDTVAPLFSSRANGAAEQGVLAEIIPGLREIHREYTIGPSRFDFLCADSRGNRHLVEVKACSLVEYGVAMFPDAPSGRALKHLEELAALSREGYCCHVLFIIVHGRPRVFIPNLHTDPLFAAALSKYGIAMDPGPMGPADPLFAAALSKYGVPAGPTDPQGPAPPGKVAIHGALLRCNAEGLAVLTEPMIPVDLSHGALAESNGGNYLLLLELAEDQDISVGALGTLPFRRGWYVYTGSAQKNLSSRVNRHLRTRKKMHWHLDYLCPWAKTRKAFPIMSYRNRECDLARDLEGLGGQGVPGFGSSDCHCDSHLFYFPGPPMGNRAFVELLLRWRHREALER
jgi:sugar fermentation stimulation protein A